MIAFRAVESLAQTAATSVTVTVPSSCQPGDLVLAAILVAGGSGVTITPPSGWQSVTAINDGTAARLEVFRHRFTDETILTPEFTFSGSAACVTQVAAYGGVDHLLPIDISGAQANASSTSAVAPSVTTTKTNAHLVAFWGAATGARTATPPASWTERADTQGAALALSVADLVQTTPAASGTKTATLSGAATNIGTLLALAPGQLVTVTEIRDEGGYRYEAFAPRFDADSDLDLLVMRLIQEADRWLFQRVGADYYTEHVTADPGYSLLSMIERQVAHANILEALAAQCVQGEGPFGREEGGRAGALRSAASERIRKAGTLLQQTRRAGRLGPWAGFRTSESAGVLRPIFDAVEGLDE